MLWLLALEVLFLAHLSHPGEDDLDTPFSLVLFRGVEEDSDTPFLAHSQVISEGTGINSRLLRQQRQGGFTPGRR